MKKTVLLPIFTLVIGFAVGIFFRFSVLPSTSGTPTRSTMNAVSAPASAAPSLSVSLSPSLNTSSGLDPEDNGVLLKRAGEVLEAMKSRDFAALSQMVHPDRGVTFTPYSTVDPDCDLCFTPAQIAAAAEDGTSYVWGVTDGKGSPIDLTIPAYFDQYVFNADYTQAPMIGVDTVLASGNAMENVTDSFPHGRFVEYYFPGLDAANMGFDWCALKLVFEVYQEQWMLVGVIHSEWNI